MDAYRSLGWFVPTLCIVGAAGLIFNRNQAFQQVNLAHQKAENDLEVASQLKAEVDRQPGERRYAAAENNAGEETQFLNDLRTRAHSTGAVLTKWTSRATTYGDPGQAPTDPSNADLLKGITRIDCDLTLSGSYRSLRDFVQGLTDSDRLFTMNNVLWIRTDSGTELTMGLARYVAPTDKSGVKPPSPATNS